MGNADIFLHEQSNFYFLYNETNLKMKTSYTKKLFLLVFGRGNNSTSLNRSRFGFVTLRFLRIAFLQIF